MLAPVSVIIPCFRCGDTIARALDSVLTQTRPVAEIILVDDASGDNTTDILVDLAKNDAQRIRVITLLNNRGPGGARNAAWEVATQPWLAFLDADDAWHSKKIELQFGWLEQQSDIVLCAHESMLWNTVHCLSSPAWLPPFKLAAYPMLLTNPIPTRSVILRKDLPYRFGVNMRSEDLLLWLTLAFSGQKLWKLPLPLAFTFRPEFSPGGYSGNLIEHEKCELSVFKALYDSRILSLPIFLAASLFSLIKFFRRYLIVLKRKLSL